MASVEKEDVEKRKIVSHGYRWGRFIVLPLIIFFILILIQGDNDRSISFLIVVILSALYFLLWRWKKLQHDSQNLYVIRGNKTQVIPFTSIISIKRSRTKINGGRFWILKYKNELEETRTIRYNTSFTKEFRQSVRIANPDVVIWEHPFFNH